MKAKVKLLERKVDINIAGICSAILFRPSLSKTFMI